eukprot:3070454-Amphidinium_carterae.1
METASSFGGPRAFKRTLSSWNQQIIDLDVDSSFEKKSKVDDGEDIETKQKSDASIDTTTFNQELEEVVERELADMLGPTPDN